MSLIVCRRVGVVAARTADVLRGQHFTKVNQRGGSIMLNHLKKTVLIASASAAIIAGATSSAATAQAVDPNQTAA